MRSDVGRCLYGFTNAPVQATISIVGAGDSPIATVVTGEKNGWLSLSANGFTFSEKILQVKFSQEVSVPAPAASPTPSAVAKPTAAKKTSITCVKGKTSKKVTAVNPVCPKGFKKK
jgi:hypothetical protein